MPCYLSYLANVLRHCHAMMTSLLSCSRAQALQLGFATMRLADGKSFWMQVLEDVTEFETSADGVTETQMEQILLNGNNIALLVPGGKPE